MKCGFNKTVRRATKLAKLPIFLKTKFPGRVTSKNGDIKWPLRSCDLTSLDYLLGGFFPIFARAGSLILRLFSFSTDKKLERSDLRHYGEYLAKITK